MWPIYYVIMYAFVLMVRISTLWNPKSRQWISGRKNWFAKINQLTVKSEYRIWFHVSSLGEFEQARPVIERIKGTRPGTEIILTFFSPSGYALKHEYAQATVLYLPADLPGNARKWLGIIQPDFAVFVKYDLWPGYLKALAEMRIPAILFSAHWIPGPGLKSWSNPLINELLKKFKAIFLQRNIHMDFFKKEGFNNIHVAGDTRIDRSLKLPMEVKERLPHVLLSHRDFDLVAGSTWPADEDILITAIHHLHLKVIIAPHDVSTSNIERLIKKMNVASVRLSEWSDADREIRMVIVDSIGLLSVLYSTGRIAYIGGGFGKGIHNTLEPMAHGKPVIFGPRYAKFPEAVDMIEAGGAWSIQSGKELTSVLVELTKPGQAEIAGNKCKQYLTEHAGASGIISDYILKSLPYIA